MKFFTIHDLELIRALLHLVLTMQKSDGGFFADKALTENATELLNKVELMIKERRKWGI